MVKFNLKTLVWINFIFLSQAARKTVHIIPTSALDLNDNDIIRVFTHNKSNARDFENLTIAVKDTEEIFYLDGKTDSYVTGNGETQEINTLIKIVPEFDLSVENVSAQCRKDSELFKRELRKMSLWAVKKDQLYEQVTGQYCLVYLQINIDKSRADLTYLHRLTHSHYAFRSNLTDPGHRVPRFSTVNWAVCTPASCSPQDVETSFKDKLAKYTTGTGLDVTIRVDREMCQVQRTKSLPIATIIVGIFFAGVIILSIVSAVCDHYNVYANEILLSFSLKRNFRKLISLQRSQNDIATVHGPWTVLGRAASLYTDPFIMLSGLLTTYSLVQQLDKSGKIDIKKEYLSRLLRLVPTLGALILFCTFVMPYIGLGPQWNLVVTHHAEICKRTWWRNLLFIHNYFGFENMSIIRLGWMVTSLAALAAFLGPAGMGSIHYVYDPIHAAAYNAFAPIGWCALFAWIVVVSHTDNSTSIYLLLKNFNYNDIP
ncbi:hypothetical protein G9C98_007696 [Cotesia typhae]|uniref:Nose resistant-to-fluoxetine protein N-terminal domain-containing protein n=1 Tax=Cotesia typhae TaxID=2053667 RepID=A0A8J5UT06_9HYME|nr:hypothetical protein G9C98_007696 [Cotesia typhae]